MTARILFVVVAVLTFAIDRIAKVLVERRIALGDRVEVIGNLFELRHVRNSGIAFGLFSNAGSLVVAGTLLVGALLFVFMLRVEPEDLMTVLGGALITGGALGNLVDRISYSYVIDFLHLPHWPTFNVADVAIVAGVSVVVLAQLLAMRDEIRLARATPASTSTDTDAQPHPSEGDPS